MAKAKGWQTPPLKWHGGKWYLAAWLASLMPRGYRHYVELFAGGANLLLSLDPSGVSEVLNDLNGELANLYRVLQRNELFADFRAALELIPFGRGQWKEARQWLRKRPDAGRVERAVRFFVLNRMSLAGRMDAFTGVTKTRTRCGMNAEVAAYLGAVDGLADVHRRLRRVLIENRPAVDLIPKHDVDGAVLYCDPPYVAGTRAAPLAYGEYEMSDADHAEFLAAVTAVEHAKVMVSGYGCRLYDRQLKGWNRHERDVANHAAGGERKARKTEVVWTNY